MNKEDKEQPNSTI